MTEQPERATPAEHVLMLALCQWGNQFPGPTAWLCRAAQLEPTADVDDTIAQHADWLNKPGNEQLRTNTVSCMQYVQRVAAKPPLWQLPTDLTIVARTWLPGDDSPINETIKQTEAYTRQLAAHTISDTSGGAVVPAPTPPPHPVPREQRHGTVCEDYETQGCSLDACPEGCFYTLAIKQRAEDRAADLQAAADGLADWINGAPCIDPAATRALLDRLESYR